MRTGRPASSESGGFCFHRTMWSIASTRIGVQSDAEYVKFETLADRKQMPGIRWPVLDWPYVEGLRMDEAMNDLAILAVGLYGKELPNQNGAPVRLVVPWKYGFKSIKSVVRIRLHANLIQHRF